MDDMEGIEDIPKGSGAGSAATGFVVEREEDGDRLDRLISARLDVSRSIARRMVEEGLVSVEGAEASPARKVRTGESVEAVMLQDEGLTEEEIPVPILFEDEYLIVVDKPAGLVVHPGAGNPSGTLVNALLGHGISGGGDPQRPGIVHRLDRDTSGLMVVAKSEEAYSGLVGMLSRREVSKIYRAIVVGTGLPGRGTVDSPVGRDPENPTLMAAGVGKQAITHFDVLAEVTGHTMLLVKLQTGRTHQIRVHLSAIGYPVYADPLYGTPVHGCRLWLHAEHLSFKHPLTGEVLDFKSDILVDLGEAAKALGFDPYTA